MNKKQCSPFAYGLVVTSMIFGLSGCTNPEIVKMEERISCLETENAELRAKLGIVLARQNQTDNCSKAVSPEIFSQAFLLPAQARGQASSTLQAPLVGQQASAQPQAKAPSAVNNQTSAMETGDQAAGCQSATEQTFADLQDAPNQELIEQLTKAGVFKSMGPNFKPYQSITRGEYVAWLFNANNALQPPAKQIHFAPQLPQQFKDVSSAHPYYKYVQALSNAGFSVGYQDGTFRPDKPITREELVAIKVGVDLGKSSEPQKGQMGFVWKFSDAADVDERYSGYIHDDYYISGPNGSNIKRAFGKIGAFKPRQAVLRCEAAATLWQFGHGDWARTALAAAENRGIN